MLGFTWVNTPDLLGKSRVWPLCILSWCQMICLCSLTTWQQVWEHGDTFNDMGREKFTVNTWYSIPSLCPSGLASHKHAAQMNQEKQHAASVGSNLNLTTLEVRRSQMFLCSCSCACRSDWGPAKDLCPPLLDSPRFLTLSAVIVRQNQKQRTKLHHLSAS